MTTPRKTAAASKAATPAADLAVDFNFDTWVREIEVKPYVIAIGGKPYTAADVANVDFRAFNLAANSEDESELFKLLFPRDYEKILAAKVIPLGALGDFSQKVLTHYGLGPTGA